jgi:hypothetical protein
MPFRPLDKMWERVDIAREDSDTSLFFDLLYVGEMVTKIVVAGMVAAISEGRERYRYRQIHRLVRADGLGEWTSALDEILTGPTSQHLLPEAREEQRELTQRLGPSSWQYEACTLLANCLNILKLEHDPMPAKVDGKRWFSTFAYLRNKTRGHGAPTGSDCARVCRELEASIKLVTENFRVTEEVRK